jgi:hypothetical protein
VLLFAAVGSIAALKIQYAFNVQPKYMIAYSLSGYVFICLLGLVRYVCVCVCVCASVGRWVSVWVGE